MRNSHVGYREAIPIVSIAAFALALWSGYANAFELVSRGDSLVVACKNITIHAKSDAFSGIVGHLKFSDRVTATQLAGLFELPSSDYSSRETLERRAQQEADEKDIDPDPVSAGEYTRASWVQIGNAKFVSNSCLVTPANFKQQTIENSEKKVNRIASGSAKRGFSEDETGDLTAMRGASGKATGGPADYKKIDRLIDNAQGEIDFAGLKLFRRAGNLGEFK